MKLLLKSDCIVKMLKIQNETGNTFILPEAVAIDFTLLVLGHF